MARPRIVFVIVALCHLFFSYFGLWLKTVGFFVTSLFLFSFVTTLLHLQSPEDFRTQNKSLTLTNLVHIPRN
jgi:hypothetical protein